MGNTPANHGAMSISRSHIGMDHKGQIVSPQSRLVEFTHTMGLTQKYPHFPPRGGYFYGGKWRTMFLKGVFEMELLAVFLVVFLIGVQVGQFTASWAIYYALSKLIKVLIGRHETHLIYPLPDEIIDSDNRE